MRKTLALAVTLAVVFASPALAEEPKGFAEFPWGTPAAKVREGMKPRCKSLVVLRPDFYQCEGYRIADLGGDLALMFVPNVGLSGWMFQTKPRNPTLLRALISDRFGSPHHDSPSGGLWRWPDVTASLDAFGGSILVMTQQAMSYDEQQRREKAEKSKKDF